MSTETSAKQPIDMKQLKYLFGVVNAAVEVIAEELECDPDLVVRIIKIHFDRKRAGVSNNAQ